MHGFMGTDGHNPPSTTPLGKNPGSRSKPCPYHTKTDKKPHVLHLKKYYWIQYSY